MSRAERPCISVIVFVRIVPATLADTLRSLELQERFDGIEVILADSSSGRETAEARARFPWLRHLPMPGANMPTLKGQAIRAARADLVAVLDPVDTPREGWLREIEAGLADERTAAVGGAVVLPRGAGRVDRALYLFEYGAFIPPLECGPTKGDLPGNNVAYRRRWLTETCADILDEEGFNKPLCHQRILDNGGVLSLRPSMEVRHATNHRLRPVVVRRFHYGRCYGATRRRRSTGANRALYLLGVPLVAPLLVARHLSRALTRPSRRRLARGALWPLFLVCASWGVGEWLGVWFGPARSCEELY